MLKPTLLAVLTVSFISPALAYSGAYNRAMVLGRAHGAALACGAPEDQRKLFVEMSQADISSKAKNVSDEKDAQMRFGLETGKTRQNIQSGAVDCSKALWFYQDQFEGLESKYKAKTAK